MVHCKRSNLIIIAFTQARSIHEHKINAFCYFIIVHTVHVVLTATMEGPHEEHAQYLHI